MLKNWLLNRRKADVEKVTGIAVKDRETLLALANLKQLILPSSLVFYEGDPVVRQYFAVQDQTMATRQEVLHLAGSLVRDGQHPILQSIKKAAEQDGMALREADMDMIEEMGGIGKLDRTTYVLGDEALMSRQEVELGVTVQTLAHQFELDGKYTIFLAQRHPKRLLAIFACEYELKPGGADVVSELKQLGIESVLLTGVKTRIAKGLGNRLGVSLIHSELAEPEKGRIVTSLVVRQPDSAMLVSGSERPAAGTVFTVGVGESEGDVKLPEFTQLPHLIRAARKAVS